LIIIISITISLYFHLHNLMFIIRL
jgi:hypothetical protein